MTINSRSSTPGKKPTVILTRRAIKNLQKASPQIKATVQSSKAPRVSFDKKNATHRK